MRQAGRSDPAYRAYRERVGLALEALFRSPAHSAAISLLPQRFGVDAIILFQDILTPVTPMGTAFRFAPGPRLDTPIRSPEQVRALRSVRVEHALAFVGEAIQRVLTQLQSALPLIAFAGAPFTLAAFLVEGHSPMAGMPHTLALAQDHPAAFADLIDRLSELTADYLVYQVQQGAHVVQLFESLGPLIPEELYMRYAFPSHQRIFSALPAQTPSILFVREAPWIDALIDSGASAISVGAGTDLRRLQQRCAGRVAIQGNVDQRLLAQGPPQAIDAAVQACIEAGGGRGHILNLAHGVLPETPFEHVQRFVQAAKRTPMPPAPL